MLEEKQDFISNDAAAPRWVGIIVVALAVVSLAALGVGWTASTRSKDLAQNLATSQQQEKQQQQASSSVPTRPSTRPRWAAATRCVCRT